MTIDLSDGLRGCSGPRHDGRLKASSNRADNQIVLVHRFCGTRKGTFLEMYDHCQECYPGMARLFAASLYWVHPDSVEGAKPWFCEVCREIVGADEGALFSHLWKIHRATQETCKYILGATMIRPHCFEAELYDLWSFGRYDTFERLTRAVSSGATVDQAHAKLLV